MYLRSVDLKTFDSSTFEDLRPSTFDLRFEDLRPLKTFEDLRPSIRSIDRANSIDPKTFDLRFFDLRFEDLRSLKTFNL
ncbi:hypothetical protein C2857_005595 [Epichloe festucae Fl1]|uniref:Uncharacterized protein n=1 Tax=Epichloe festucae (strain Fl1) TaxID=877507 RepID=A0A7S9PVT5_EPIFF|nr:hypothetical protein C2857_005595 [Epichloe festucae Fl1]